MKYLTNNRSKMRKIGLFQVLLIGCLFLFAGCGNELSSITGWEYNNPRNGGYEVSLYIEQETGPGLILIEGGRHVHGGIEQDLHIDWDNIERTVTVPSFYIDESEVANIHYLEYLYWLQRVFAADYPEVYYNALPDTLVWREDGAFNEPYVELYLRHPAYHFYPVVGVSWVQAMDFCSWRTDRVNEMIMMREGILRMNPDQYNEDNFNTDAYYYRQYEGLVRGDLLDMNPNRDTRKVRKEDGILLPRYRLPTETEWEFAALGLIGNLIPGSELRKDRRIYPWNGHTLRTYDEKVRGHFMANFVRGRGDYAGVAGYLNDNAFITAPVKSYWPNDYGLYNMSGNVSEWVYDVYRTVSSEDKNEFNSFRGNVYQTPGRDSDGMIAEKDSLGKITYLQDTANYPHGPNVKGFADRLIDKTNGDRVSYYNPSIEKIGTRNYATLVTDVTRVYKGGSWKDRAYYMSAGARRRLHQKESESGLGFRCAMARVGAPNQMGEAGH